MSQQRRGRGEGPTAGTAAVVLVVVLVLSVGMIASTARADATAMQTDGPGVLVSIEGTNSPVVEGEELAVTAVVENTRDEGTTQEVTLAVGDEVRDVTEVRLDPGDIETVDLTWQTGSGDAGSHIATVAGNDDQDSTEVSVGEGGASFEVELRTTNSPVVEGERLVVAADVTNAGEAAGEREVALAIDGTIVESDLVSLGPGEVESVYFTWQTDAGEAGEYVATVATASDADSAVVTVEEPPESAFFAVSIEGTNSPVEPGGTVLVDATVENVGETDGTQSVEFSAREFDATESVSLDGGESANLTFEWETSNDDLGTHTVTVSTANATGSASVNVTADRPAFVSGQVGDGTPDVVRLAFDQQVFLNGTTAETAGFAVRLDDRDVDLVGASTTGVDVHLVLDSRVTADQGVAVSYDGESDNVENEFELEALPFETGEVVNRVGPALQANLTAIDPTTQEETGRISVDTTVEEGVRFSAAHSSVSPDTATYEWEVGDGTFTTGEPELTHQFSEPGSYDAAVTVVVGERSATATFTLEVVDETPPEVRLAGPETVEAGELSTFDASESTDNVAIAGYEWEFGDGTTESGPALSRVSHPYDEPGEYEVTVRVTDTSGNIETASTTVVVEPAGFAVSIEGTNSPVNPGETLEVSALVENTAGGQVTDRVALSVDGEERGSRELTLAGGAAESVTFQWTVPDDYEGSLDLEVMTEADSDQSQVDVESAGEFPLGSGGLILLFLLILLVIAYYYLRRRTLVERNDSDSQQRRPPQERS